MLVLSRKVGERILIGDKIAVTLLRVGPNAVRLGIEAPKSVNIRREELEQLGSVLGGLAALDGIEISVSGDLHLVATGDLVEA